MKVKLEQISANRTVIRGGSIVGDAMEVPTVGRSFVMTGPPLSTKLDHDDGRYFSSSRIKEVVKDGNQIIFRTLNSIYKITILDQN